MGGETLQRKKVVRRRKERYNALPKEGWVGKKHSKIPERRNLARRTKEQEQNA